MARVFILEAPSVNVEKAGKFGKIVILLRGLSRVSALQSDFYAGEVIDSLEEKNFNPKEDFLCLVGSMSSIAISIAAMIKRWGNIKCLIYNGSRSEYVLRTLGRWRSDKKWASDDEDEDEDEIELED